MHWFFGVLVVGVCVGLQDLEVEKLEERNVERDCSGIAKTFKNQRKSIDFCIFLKARALPKASKVAVGMACCGLDGLRKAAWKPRSLQDGVEVAKLSPRWSKLAPRWAQDGSKNYLAWITRCAAQGFGPILASSWALLGSPWPFPGGPRGHLEANLGLRGAAVGML